MKPVSGFVVMVWRRRVPWRPNLFLKNDHALLRDAFNIRNVLLQSEKETVAKIEVEVRRVKLTLEDPTACCFTSISTKKLFQPPETYSCILRLKSSFKDEAIRVQPGSQETHVFLPDGPGDALQIQVIDSKGNQCGQVLAKAATIAQDQVENRYLRWWDMYREPEHDLVGKVQLYINYPSNIVNENNFKYRPAAETVAYDVVLEAALKCSSFHQRSLLIHGHWKWLLSEFALHYGVSDVYATLKYLCYVMDVATPTAECLTLVYDQLVPVLSKSNGRKKLSLLEVG